MPRVRIALANLPVPPSREASVRSAEEAIARAGAERADVICFPEGFVPGYRAPGMIVPPPDASFLDEAWTRVGSAAQRANAAVVLGTERIVDGDVRLTALVVDRDGTRLGFQDKVQLDPTEEPTYAAGAERRVFRVGALTFGVSICHEGWRYPETVRWLVRHGAQVVFHPHFHWAEPGGFRPTTFGDPRNTFHEGALRCRAAENTCYVASVNFASDGSPTTSTIVGPDGAVISWQPYGVEGLLMSDLELDAATGYLASRYKPA
ncbi:MAG TPA: carbon-nitrogen hydrolase family protein [Gemmatimonadaceae bacterium]|nr:carbon-nitrogen hydrolase family protein [Gemmatimonadaceae bacterium]